MSGAESPQVVIVGAGPVGLTLANLLGSAGIATLIIERNPGTVPEPRAIALDGESLRTLQAAALTDVVLPTIREGFIADYLSGEGVELFESDLTPRPYGFCLQNSFDQPTLERQLLDGLSRFACVDVRFNTAFESLAQQADRVTLQLRAADGEIEAVNTAFLVACDGGRSSVRQTLGIEMQGDRLPQRWLVIDTVDTHLSGEPQCRFYCDPERPAMTMLRPGNERRWEFMLLDNERDEDLLRDERIRELLAPHTDPDHVEVYRKVVYGFSAVLASRFSEGRVFLAGDAAHMTPPFAGQGLNAGIRDVRNLSWKLVAVLRGVLPRTILETYNEERHEAAREMIDLALKLGDQIQPTDAVMAAERDAFFAELNKTPGAGKQFGSDSLAPLMDVRLAGGWLGSDEFAGRFLPQPEVSGPDGEELLDARLGQGFAALIPDGAMVPAQLSAHPLWRATMPRLVPQPGELAAFLGGDRRLLLVRPDRFVLAALPLDASALQVLDQLQEQLRGPA